MEIETLRTFVEVMKAGSFAAAARRMEVDPSAVSRTVASLENALGARLFHRTTRRLSPTEAASAYFDRIAPLIDELERAATLAADTGEELRGTLRITAAVTFAQANVVPILPEFARRHPELTFDLVLTDKILDLVEERIDVALRLGVLPDSSFIAQRLCDMHYVVAASPEYVRKRGKPETPEDLGRHDCLRYPMQGFGARWRFRRGDEPIVEVPVRGRVVASNGVALRQCAVAGMGILMLPRWNVAQELAEGTLVELLEDHEATASEFDAAVWMLYPSRSYLPRKVRVLAEYLKSSFAGGPPGEIRHGKRRVARRRP